MINYNRTRLEAKKNATGDIISFIFGTTAIDDADNISAYRDGEYVLPTPKTTFTKTEVEGYYTTWLTDNTIATGLSDQITNIRDADKIDETFDFSTLPA